VPLRENDGLIHCHPEVQAQALKGALAVRLADCGLELHPEKTRIVYSPRMGVAEGSMRRCSLTFSDTPFARAW
jgi:hypothetical protein